MLEGRVLYSHQKKVDQNEMSKFVLNLESFEYSYKLDPANSVNSLFSGVSINSAVSSGSEKIDLDKDFSLDNLKSKRSERFKIISEGFIPSIEQYELLISHRKYLISLLD